ncbi:MAG: hypothetical protein WC551_12825 [Patescibacteria group bacterium]
MDTVRPANSLAEFVTQRYEQWKQNRSVLQEKWTRNWNAYRAISEGKWKAKEGEGWRSNSFINYTKQKITSGFALVADMMLMGGKIPFMLKPSPWDEVQMEDMVEEEQKTIRESIDDMDHLIEQQLIDCAADRKLLKNILSCALFGETIAKWVVHDVVRRGYRRATLPLSGGITDVSRLPPAMTVFESFAESHNAPAWDYVSVWDIFRDLETDDLQAGAGVLHRQLVSPHWLKSRRDRPYFINSAIDKVLAEIGKNTSGEQGSNCPEKDVATLPPSLRNVKFRQNTILYLELWGLAPRDKVEEFEKEMGFDADIPAVGIDPESESESDEIECMTCVAAGEIVRYVRTTAEERPFARSVWEDCLDEIGGTGVADNAENMQFVLNGAMRAFEDNKKLSANVQGFVKRRYLDSDMKEVRPGMLHDLSEECDDAHKAYAPMVVPDVGESLLSLIALAEKYLDMETMIPKITQGIDTTQGKETAYEISQQVEKAGKYIGAIIRNQDEGLIEPMIERFYDYNMADPNVTKGKGNYIVKATGFNSFQDRLQRVKNLQQFLALIMQNPKLQEDAKFKRIMEDIGKALDVDPDEYFKSEQEKAAETELQRSGISGQSVGGMEGPGPALPPPETELDQAQKAAEIAKTQAETAAKATESRIKEEKMVLERAKAVHEMERAPAAPITA